MHNWPIWAGLLPGRAPSRSESSQNYSLRPKTPLYYLTSTSLPPLPGLPPSLTLTAARCSWASSRLHRSSWCLRLPEGCSSGPARWGTAWWPWRWQGWHSSLLSGHSYPACRERPAQWALGPENTAHTRAAGMDIPSMDQRSLQRWHLWNISRG